MLKVLVIDADSNFASQLGRAILKEGHETRIVGDARYGIVRAKTFEPDLVLIDTNIPGAVGTELIAELKSLVPGRIVVCTDSDNPDDVKNAIGAGASDYVLKSSGIDAIISRACPANNSTDSEDGAKVEDAEKSDEGEDDQYAETKSSGSTGPRVQTLRAPLKEGKRPFCVVVAHTDGEKRSFIAEIVERLNRSIHVIEVSSSMDAITACAENRTVMLVIDWEMPDISARQVMRTVHSSKHGKTISMFVTYKGKSPEKQRVAMFAGALAFAGEPWDDGSIEAQLKQVLDNIRKRRRKAKIRALKAKAS